MRHAVASLAALLVLSGLATAALADETAPSLNLGTLQSVAQPPAGPLPVGDPGTLDAARLVAARPATPEARRTLSPLMSALYDVLDAADARVVELRTRLSATRDPMAALELQRQIEHAKQDTEVQVLRVQADHARANGRLDQARRIDEAIAQMSAPPRVIEPATRPAPPREDAR